MLRSHLSTKLKRVGTRFLENIVGGKGGNSKKENVADEEILIGDADDNNLKGGSKDDVLKASMRDDVFKGIPEMMHVSMLLTMFSKAVPEMMH